MTSNEPNHLLNQHSGRPRELAAIIHPSRFAERLDASLAASTVLQLQKTPRLQERLVELLLGSELVLKGSSWGRGALLGHDPHRAALLAGGIWHARSVLKLVSKHDLAPLIGNIGAEAHAFAIRHVSSAVETQLIVDPEQLSQRIAHDGYACLGAFLKRASELDRTRVLLCLPVGTAAESPAAEHHKAAGQLMSLVMTHLAAETRPA
ncbi:nodulation protein NolU (plasmid) [Bradyrhizobium sp. CCBAU 53351]|nr:nodulation protein NolU [Bradyrhizobium guangdongense]QAU50584.1 nodulation protein NolU [Bradyrhizobium guangzhouense]QOZ49913.1 nodulation protein NolU [Bradyrhizobium sp. CCBAU 53340]QOZ57274.1 nodulation protein NolU [Bradyrhizobium sp. CCBAU 53338]QOZ81522.1 nodulation protein NolU [Bradyrhizobium sp. CCBAU 53351]